MGYGGIIGQQFDGYTQNQTLTQAVAALYGLGTDAVPNDVFNILSKSALYKTVSPKQQIGNLPVGTTIYLNENGSPVPYLIVNQGIPQSSSLYDSSCNGTWVLRQDIYSSEQWNSNNINGYNISTVNTTYLPSLLNLYDSDVQSAIKQVKIPYVKGDGEGPALTGPVGLSCKIFLLSAREVGFSYNESQYSPNDGEKLSYFESGTGSSANNKRIAKLNGSDDNWWTRSPYTNGTNYTWYITDFGYVTYNNCNISYGIRPAFILPTTFICTLAPISGLYDTQDNLIMSIPSMGFSPANIVTGSYTINTKDWVSVSVGFTPSLVIFYTDANDDDQYSGSGAISAQRQGVPRIITSAFSGKDGKIINNGFQFKTNYSSTNIVIYYAAIG